MQLALIATLCLLLCGGGLVLVLDGRQRRIDRQIRIAMPTDRTASFVSIRRERAVSKWHSIHQLVHYRPDLAYPVSPGVVALLGLGVAAADIYASRFAALPLAPVLPMAALSALMVVRGLFGWMRRRLSQTLFLQMPDAIELVLSTVRAGLPVSEAFQIIAREMPQPTAGQFAKVCSEMAMGRAAEEALEDVRERTGVAEFGIFAVALAVQSKSGGRLGEMLQTLGDTVRQRVALVGRAKAMAGEVIFSSRALSISPVITGGLLYTISPRTVDMLFIDPTRRLLLAYGVGSTIVGVLVIQYMIRRETAL